MMQEESDAGSDGESGKGDSGTIEPSDNVQNYEDGYTIEGAWARNRAGESGNNGSSGSGTIPTQKSTKYFWDAENRMIKAEHQGSTTHFQYDASGQRTSKKNGNKESLYFDKMWQSTYTSPNTNANHMEFKNIYLGKDRLLTKLGNGLYHDKSDNSYQKENQYFNHANHIGSVNVISDSKGQAFRYIEYTPYGEQWFVEDNRMQGPVGVGVLEYGFTDHLHDEETGLIYANARYLDPKTSRWLSTDPAMEEYIPLSPEHKNAQEYNQNLPGLGGVFNSRNLQTYHYAGNNPLKYTDPTGMYDYDDYGFPEGPWLDYDPNTNNRANSNTSFNEILYAEFRSGADPIQTSKSDFAVACWYFATIASLQAVGHKPTSGAQGDKLGDEIMVFIDGNYRQSHALAASAIFGGNFRFNDLGDVRKDNQGNPINLNGLKANTAGVVVFKQNAYWKNSNTGEHAISLIRNEDGTFSARDPYDGKEVQVREDPNNPGGIQIKRWNDEDWRPIEIQRLYSIEPVD